MAYTKTQFISYQIDTFPQKDTSDAFGKRYLGADKSLTDIHYRCNLMKNAIDNAYNSGYISASSGTMKIFMAPEFYFRGKEGAYPLEQVSTIIEVLREHTKDLKFRDWLFVFGTALGYLDDVDNAKEVFNIAMVQKGGTDESDVANCVLVYKEFISHIDFIREKLGKTCPGCKRFIPDDWDENKDRYALIGKSTGDTIKDMSILRPTKGSRDLLSRHVEESGEGREKTKTGLGGQSIFTIGGITFGLEVCKDHLVGRLRDSPPAKGDNLVQIQLIPSAGAWIEEDHVACMKGGLIFNVDGNSETQVNRNIGDYDTPKLQYSKYPNGIHIAGTVDLDLSGVASRWGDFFNEEGYIYVFTEQGIPQAKTK